MTNRITTVFEAVDRSLSSTLRKVRADVAAADTAMGKFKAGASGAFAALKANAVPAAAAAGAALTAFAAKSVQAFQQGALAAGEFSDATGTSTEAASQWISAAGDLGINADLVQKAFQKANKEIAEGGGVIDEYGISVRRAADGQVDANETFLAAIDTINRINDPTEKARVAQELFGRSYGDIAELIFQDAEKVRAALESTSEQQVFDEAEVEKARRLRDAMDQLGDAVADVQLIIGEKLVPVLSDAGETLVYIDSKADDAAEALDKIPGPIKSIYNSWNKYLSPKALMNPFGWFGGEAEKSSQIVDRWARETVERFEAIEDVNESADRVLRNTARSIADQAETMSDAERTAASYGVSVDDLGAHMAELTRATQYQTDAEEEAERATEEHTQAILDHLDAQRERTEAVMAAIGGDIAYRDAQHRAAEALRDLTETQNDAEKGAGDVQKAQDDAAEAMIRQAEAATRYAEQQAEANGKTLTAGERAIVMREELEKIAQMLAPGSALRSQLQGYIDQLGMIPDERRTQIATFQVNNGLPVVAPTQVGAGGQIGSQVIGPGGQVGSQTVGGATTQGTVLGTGNTYVYSPMFDGGEKSYQEFKRFVDEHDRRTGGVR